MSRPRRAANVKLVMSFITADAGAFCESLRILAGHFGGPDFISAWLPFDYTRYYEREMGAWLARRLIGFEKLISPESLPDIKLQTNRVEDRFSPAGQRVINIDPGYLSASHLILATGKGYTHRPYLRDGIYADLTLIYTDGAFHALPWTYPDYAGEYVTALLQKMRGKYLEELKRH